MLNDWVLDYQLWICANSNVGVGIKLLVEISSKQKIFLPLSGKHCKNSQLNVTSQWCFNSRYLFWQCNIINRRPFVFVAHSLQLKHFFHFVTTFSKLIFVDAFCSAKNCWMIFLDCCAFNRQLFQLVLLVSYL
jgi:hypothetical protein